LGRVFMISPPVSSSRYKKGFSDPKDDPLCFVWSAGPLSNSVPPFWATPHDSPTSFAHLTGFLGRLRFFMGFLLHSSNVLGALPFSTPPIPPPQPPLPPLVLLPLRFSNLLRFPIILFPLPPLTTQFHSFHLRQGSHWRCSCR